MSRDPYITFVNAKGTAITVVFAWVGSVLGPLFIVSEMGNYNEWPFYIGVGLTIAAIVSIWHGFKAIRRGVYSDFVVYSVVPLLLPVLSIVLLVVSSDA